MATSEADIKTDLGKRITGLLNGCIGASPLPSRAEDGGGGFLRSPFSVGIIGGFIFFCLFCVVPIAVTMSSERSWPERHLLWFSVYGSLYFAWATFIARQTSMQLQGTVHAQIIPSLSLAGAKRVYDSLGGQFSDKRINIVSILAACIGILLAVAAISYDVGYYPFQIGWWAVGWFVLFLTAARTTYVGRFYSCFAKDIDKEPIYALDPARSMLITGVTTLGHLMLLFWSGILISIVPLILFATLGDQQTPSPYWYEQLPLRSAFVWLVVPVTSAFSIPFGTLVYLESEKAIRTVVTTVLRNTLLSTERQIAVILAKKSELTERELLEMNVLSAVHSRLADRGKYRGALAVVLSLLIPAIGPATTVLKFIIEHQKHP
jgi:hypothetical protein